MAVERLEAARARERQGTRTDLVERIPQGDDGKAAAELSADGASTREIAEVIGVSHMTAARDLAGTNVTEQAEEQADPVTNETPAPLDAAAVGVNPRYVQDAKKVAAVAPVAAHGGERVKVEQVDSINLTSEGGTSATYTLRRLKRAKRRLGELARDLETVQGEHLPNVPASGRMGKRAVLRAAGVSTSEAPSKLLLTNNLLVLRQHSRGLACWRFSRA